jgi:hypothetical protein
MQQDRMSDLERARPRTSGVQDLTWLTLREPFAISLRDSGGNAELYRPRLQEVERLPAEAMGDACDGLWENVLRLAGPWRDLLAFAEAAPISAGAARRAYDDRLEFAREPITFADYLLQQRDRLPLQLGSLVPAPGLVADEWRQTNWGSSSEAIFRQSSGHGAEAFHFERYSRVDYRFATSGGTPEGAVCRMSAVYAELLFEIQWADPVLGYFGIAGYRGGELTEDSCGGEVT